MNKFKAIKEKMKGKAKKDIVEFFKLAKSSFKLDRKKANLYVHKARKLAMKHNIRLSSSVKKRFCKHCYSYLVPGENCRIRTRAGKIVYYCLECKKYMRFLIKKS
jgi:ribonuclease P protein subunit RPR2